MTREILVPLDGSVSAEAALMHAVAIAKKRNATLVLMRVHPPPIVIAGPAEMGVYYPDPELEAQLRDVAEGWLTARTEALRHSTGLPVDAGANRSSWVVGAGGAVVVGWW